MSAEGLGKRTGFGVTQTVLSIQTLLFTKGQTWEPLFPPLLNEGSDASLEAGEAGHQNSLHGERTWGGLSGRLWALDSAGGGVGSWGAADRSEH